MMIDEAFFFLDNGAFGEIRGFRKIQIPENEKQQLLDNNTRVHLSTFDPPSGLSPAEYSAMFQNEFLKARQKTRDQTPDIISFSVSVQVGNSESLREINIIENHKLFSHWEDENFVNNFKNLSKKYLGE
jgi:hypothetical protein